MAWAQACLPIRHGGVGIRDPLRVAPSARLSAFIHFHQRAVTMVGLPSGVVSTLAPDVSGILEALAAQLGPNFAPLNRLRSGGPTAFATAEKSCSNQRWWADAAAVEGVTRLEARGPVRDRARLLAQKGGNAWMSFRPSRVLHADIPTREYLLLLC